MKLLENFPERTSSPDVEKARTILKCAHEAASSFYEVFRRKREARDAVGTARDEEYDQLRAMLVFAAAGLDSMVKQLVKDALRPVLVRYEGAMRQFQVFVERRLQKEGRTDRTLLARVLTATDSRDVLVDALITALTEDSLQSVPQLFKVAAHFDIPSKDLGIDTSELVKIFTARNEIIHEMDIDFGLPRRTQRTRPHEGMKEYARQLLRVAGTFLVLVEKKIK